MTIQSGIDPTFLKALAALAGSTDELEFERLGYSFTTYCLHGQVVSVDAALGTIKIRRTRTHAGEVHEMGLRYFLSATGSSGVKLRNLVAEERNQAYVDKQQARVNEVALASENPAHRPGEEMLRSMYIGMRRGTLEGYPAERHVYQDRGESGRRVCLIAKSFSAVEQFMAMQDIFMPLDDMLWHAVNARVLWPAGIAFDRQDNPQAWSVDWFKIYDVLAGIPPSVLCGYLERIRSSRPQFGPPVSLAPPEAQLLVERGLLQYEEPPTSVEETLDRITLPGLRQLLKQAGSAFKATTRAAVVEEVRRHMTPDLTEAAKQLMRPPHLQLKAPAGLTIEEFARAVNELRDSIFLMRQWLRASRDIFREDALSQLVEVA